KHNSARFLQLRQSRVEISVADPADIDIEDSFFNFSDLSRPCFLYRSGACFVLQSNFFGFARVGKSLDCEIHGLPLLAQVEQAQSIPAYPLWSSAGNELLFRGQSFSCRMAVYFHDGVTARELALSRGAYGGNHQLAFNPIPLQRQGCCGWALVN